MRLTMMIEFRNTAITDGAVLGPNRPSQETGAAKRPAGRIEMIPLTPFGQVDD